MSCSFCQKHLPSMGQSNHTFEKCPFRLSITCQKCCLKGHLSSECSYHIAWERPRYIEDLLPPDVKARWNITTQTPIIHTPIKKSHDIERGFVEINPDNTYKIQNKDKEIRAFMKKNGIHSTHEKVENMRIISEWAIRKGYRVEFVKET